MYIREDDWLFKELSSDDMHDRKSRKRPEGLSFVGMLLHSSQPDHINPASPLCCAHVLSSSDVPSLVHELRSPTDYNRA